MKKRIVRIILSAMLIIALTIPSAVASDKPYRDPNTPMYILGISFDIQTPEVGEIPASSAVPLHDEVSATISWSSDDPEWDATMPFAGGHEYTLKIQATTSGKDYFHDWVLDEGNIGIDFRHPVTDKRDLIAPTKSVLNSEYSLDVYYTFTLEAEVTPKTPFTDIEVGSYCEDAVAWALEVGVTTGTTDTTFSPSDPCTRAQAVTFLWRAMGCPEPKSTNHSFTDVKNDDYFYKSVLWAIENGITNGTSATTFSPDETCTGGHVITFLHRANGCIPAEGESALAKEFPETWFTDALAWADSTGLLSGVGEDFSPIDEAPRADIVTYIYRNAVK